MWTFAFVNLLGFLCEGFIMEHMSHEDLYAYLRHCGEIDLGNEYYYRVLLDNFFIPFQGTMYGDVLIYLGRELNRPEPIISIQECVGLPGVILFDLVYMMDLGEVMQKWANSRNWELR